jgi:hypothetical protein
MTQNYIPFQEIVAEIRQLCARGVTGTLFVATKANRSAQLVLENGKIVFVYFFNKRGEKAVELMSTIRAGRYRFQEGSVSRRDSLPSTENILQSLIGGQRVVDQVSEKLSAGPGLSQEQKNILETCLAGYIGPMAGIICEDHLNVVADLPAAIDALVSEIPSPEHAEKFRAKVLATLG